MSIVLLETKVYAGPCSTGVYAHVGTLFAGDSYTLLWNEYGYKYVEYPVSNGVKRGYISGGTDAVPTAFSSGVLGTVTEYQSVLSTPGSSPVSMGSVNEGEVVTVLIRNSSGYTYIEYGTASGTKRGWIPHTKVTINNNSALAKMSVDDDVYVGPLAGDAKIGSLEKEEFVVVLAENNTVGLVEYCIGVAPYRKQGYVSKSSYAKLNNTATIPAIPSYVDPDGESATMQIRADVYAGPDSIAYAKIGSVSASEPVSVIFKELNWFNISYSTENGFKRGYVPRTSVSNYASVTEKVSDKSNAWRGCGDAVNARTTAYTGPNSSLAEAGAIGAGEAVTKFNYTENGYTMVEYSTNAGAKRGFVASDAFSALNRGNLAIVSNEDVDVYYDSVYTRVSCSVGLNEYVVVLAQDRGSSDVEASFFVEYNTASGRKRGFIKQQNLTKLGTYTPEVLSYNRTIKSSKESQTVYAGPGDKYAVVGSIYNDELVTELDTDGAFSQIEYTVGTSFKVGYVPTNKLQIRDFFISDMRAYADERILYGTSGMGRALYAYRIGNGDNHLILNFTIHGWEDVWSNSGRDIERVGEATLASLWNYKSVISSRNWSVYVILASNPDGLMDGNMHDGPGRCTVKSYDANKAALINVGVDMNRCFEYIADGQVTRITETSNPRYYTGPYGACWTPEAEALKDFIADYKSATGENIFIDVHGYTNQIIISQTNGRTDLRAAFRTQFNTGAYGVDYTCSGGYVARYACDLHGMQGCLFEFPNSCTYDGCVKELGYDVKFINVIKHILDTYPLS